MKNSLKIKQSLLTALTISAALTLSACGGGSGGTAATTSTSSSGTPITGVASKGIISGATVTAYCGGQKASPQVIIGTATTDANGNYSLTPTSTCALPVEVVLTPKTGAQMLDEATGLLVTLPSTFTMRAYIANPGTTISTNITPFTNMAAAAINASSSAPSAANVGAAINAVIKSVLGGDDLLYSAKPKKPADAAAGTLEEKKLSALLTAISSHANSLLKTGATGATDTGSAMLLALKELDDSATATITVSSTGASVIAATGGKLAPSDIMNHDKLEAEDHTINTNTDAQSITSFAPILTVYTGPITATTPGITTAKALFTSLRTNLVLLSKSDKTGFMDTQVSAVRTDMKGFKHTSKGVADFMSISKHAIDLFRNFPTGLPPTFASSYKSGMCYPDLTTPTSIDCYWGDNFGIDGSGTDHFTILTPGTANTYNWSDTLETYIGWAPTPASTSPVQTGTVTATYTTGGGLNSIAFNGTVAPLDSTADHSNVTFAANVATVSGNDVLTTTGGVTNYADAAGTNSLLTLTFGTGSNVVVTPPASPTGSATFVSATFVGIAKSVNYQFDGNLTTTGIVTDTSSKMTVPASASFTGSITDVTNAAVGKFMTGTMTETTNLTGYDATLLTSPANFKKLNFVFNGSIVNGTVTPAMTYAVNMTIDETVFGQKGLTLTYTDPSNNAVTIARNSSTPNALIATSGGITVNYTPGVGGYVFSGDATNPANQIGTISAKIANFTDGSFISL